MNNELTIRPLNKRLTAAVNSAIRLTRPKYWCGIDHGIGTKMGINKFCRIAVAVILASHFSFGQERRLPIVAVTSFEGRKVDSEDTKTLSDALSDNLVKSGKVRVIERMQIDLILREQGLQTSGACDNQSCAVEMGKILGVSRIIVGSISRIGAIYSMNVKMVDVQTGEILKSASQNSADRIDLLLTKSIPAIASEILGTHINTSWASRRSSSSQSDSFPTTSDFYDAISSITDIGVVVKDLNPIDSTSSKMQIYIANNSPNPITKASFTLGMQCKTTGAGIKVLYAPNCESMTSRSKTGYSIAICCSKLNLEPGGIWPRTRNGIRIEANPPEGKTWLRVSESDITPSWTFYKNSNINAQ